MANITITKKLEKQMLEGARASFRKGKSDWQNVENYHVNYEYPVTWQWWKNIKAIYGENFDVTLEKATNCNKKRFLTCYPSTKRDTKTGDVLPWLRVYQNVRINPQKPETTLNYDEKEAAFILTHIKKFIEKTAKDAEEKLFHKDSKALFEMILSYTRESMLNDANVKKAEAAFEKMGKRLWELKKKVREEKVRQRMAYNSDIVSVLKKNKFKMPEDLLKDVACGNDFSVRVIRNVCNQILANNASVERKIKSGDIDHAKHDKPTFGSWNTFYHQAKNVLITYKKK